MHPRGGRSWLVSCWPQLHSCWLPPLYTVCRRNPCRCQAAGRVGKGLLDFLAAPDTVKVMKAKRLEPAG
jgi:hypothetical protein